MPLKDVNKNKILNFNVLKKLYKFQVNLEYINENNL